MSIFTAIKEKEPELNGVRLTELEAKNLKGKLPSGLVPDWLISLLQQYPVIGVCFSLDEDLDESEMGVDLKWFDPDQIIEEALSVYPGKVVVELGYLPVGACLAGSGDPYFLRIKEGDLEDAALVRIPHDLVSGDTYPENEIETVCSSLSKFFEGSEID